MTFDLVIPRRNARMVVLAIAIQRPAKNFVIAFITRANRFDECLTEYNKAKAKGTNQ